MHFFRAGRRGYFPFSGGRRRASTVHVDVLPRLHLISTPPRTQTIHNSSSLPPFLSLPITPFPTSPHLNSRSTMPYSLILHYLLHRILYPHTAFIKSTPVQRHRLASFLFRSSPVSPRSSRIPIRFDLIRSRLSLVNIVSYSSGCCAGAFSFSRQCIYTSGALISPHAVLAVPERYAFIIALRFFKSFIDNVQLQRDYFLISLDICIVL